MSENEKKDAQPQGISPLFLMVMLLMVGYAAVAYYKHADANPAAAEPAPQVTMTTPPAIIGEPAPATRNAETGRQIYLTFDDGPCKNTPQVLDILDRYGAKATFFTVGSFVDLYPETAADIVKRGNLIACHTYTHEFNKCYASADAFFAETEKWKRAVQKACGTLPERICVRFPGGSTTKYAADVREDIIQRINYEGYRWFDWNAADNDKWPKGNTKGLSDTEYFMQSYQECIGWYQDTPDVPVVFLFHDTEEGSVQILPIILQDLIDRGYSFRLLSEHPDWG